MLTNIREVSNCKSVGKREYSIDDFTQDMILLLPKSPKSFIHILKMAFGRSFSFTEYEIHSSINEISVEVTAKVLEGYLANVNPIPVIALKSRPEIDTDVMEVLNDNDVHIAMLIARHLYGDFTETVDEHRELSERALRTGRGTYKTTFNYLSRSVCIETSLADFRSTVYLV